MSSRAQDHSGFLALRILLTEACNISCVFCHNEGQLGTQKYSALGPAELRMIMQVGNERGLRQIKFSGGEPTLHPRLPDLVSTAVEHHMDTVVISNGMRRDALLRVAALGARISVNVPSADREAYRRLTGGGDFDYLRRTLLGLRGAGADCAINSYSRLRPAATEVKSLLALADRHGCGLKLLLPCQTMSAERQDTARTAYGDLLGSLGCQHIRDTPYDSTWRTKSGRSVRVVMPFCPIACKQVVDRYKSIRITADMGIAPCFGISARTMTLDMSTHETCAASLDKALFSTARDCGQISGVRVGRRRLLADGEQV